MGQSEPSELELSRISVVSIGRSRDNDIVIKDDTHSSRRHAEIRKSSHGYEILDLDSTGGVFVNGQKIGRACLQSGDHIRLSSTEFLYQD
jgi:pSer/pThr/pTyr-binding forkhead associated (FHA) protein